MDKLLEQITDVAREAGAIMTSASFDEDQIHQKEGHANFVTDYDSRIQNFLIEKLHEILPEAEFLGEEEGRTEFEEKFRKGYLFVLDPIDGTTNFIVGYRQSVVSIGLFKDGRPYIGVVCNPYEDECYQAKLGEGAYCNGQPIHSSDSPLERSVIQAGSAPYNKELHPETFRILAEYADRAMDYRRSGSAALDLCTIAAGRAGLYFELTLGLWDFAAGVVILTEAGGQATDIDGQPLTYDGRTSILAVSAGVAKEDYLPVCRRKTPM